MMIFLLFIGISTHTHTLSPLDNILDCHDSYELQIKLQRRGLGQYLMALMEYLACSSHLVDKAMLTVFKGISAIRERERQT